MSIKFARFVIRTILFAYTIGLICAVGLAITGNDYTTKTIVCACGLIGEILVTTIAFAFYRKTMLPIQKFLLVCDSCGIVAFSLFFVGYYQTSWAFYGLLFVAIVTYGDLFKMNTIFGKKN